MNTTTATTTTTNKKDLPVLKSAPPPLDSALLLAAFAAVFLYTFPSWENVDQAATVETFTRRVFPQIMSLQALANIRLLIAALIWAVSFQTIVLSPGWEQTTSYLMDKSKLVRVPIKMAGIRTMAPFTCLSWNLLGISFTLSGYIAWKQAAFQDAGVSEHEQEDDMDGNNAYEFVDCSPLLLRTALLVWEMAAPFTFLVASVIRYAIWPMLLKGGGDSTDLKSLRNIFMHK